MGTIWHFLTLPFRMLALGRLRVVVYTVFFGAAAVYLPFLASKSLIELTGQVSSLTSLQRNLIWAACVLSGVLLAVPPFFVAVILPMRTLWLSSSVRLSKLIEETPGAVRDFCSTMSLAVTVSLVVLLPVMATGFLYYAFIQHVASRSVWRSFVALTTVLVIVSANKSAPLVLSPFVSVLCRMPPVEVVMTCRQVLGPRTLPLVAIPLCFVAVGMKVHMLLHGDLSVYAFRSWELVLYAVLAWYAIALEAFAVLKAYTPRALEQPVAKVPASVLAPALPAPEKKDSRADTLGY